MEKRQRCWSRRTVLAIAGATLLLLGTPALRSDAGIQGSGHDFSSQGYGSTEICIFCHAPHNASTTVTEAPLWNHALTQVASYTLYSSPTLNASDLTQPGGATKLCLSCHDGTVAVDSYGTRTGATKLTGGANLGTGLKDDHPMSFTYSTALATSDGGLEDPATKQVTIGGGSGSTGTRTGSIAQVMLFNGKLECASCHDVHNSLVGGDPLLRISNSGSQLCFACHKK